jgi:hypothetical protein
MPQKYGFFASPGGPKKLLSVAEKEDPALWAGSYAVKSKILLIDLEPQFLQQLLIPLLPGKDRGPVVAITGLQYTNTVLRAAAIPGLANNEIANPICREEIPDDHLRLDLAVVIRLFREADVDPAVEVSGQLARVTDTYCISYIIQRIHRAERNQYKRKRQNRQDPNAFHIIEY